MRPARAVASFDSASGMLRALSRFLHGKDVPLIGQGPAALEGVASAVLGGAARLPRALQEQAYALSGWAEAVPMRRVPELRSGDLARWVTGHYPRRPYPVAFIGSSNGAMIHLAAGQALLDANPDLVLHHMHDANQDRLMIAGMTYFRVKWRRLAAAYRAFLESSLPPGATLVVVDCALRWPTTTVGERHVFQHGALGGATRQEYERGGPRVADYLARYRAGRSRWDYPPADGESPEAEWGFRPELLADLEELAERNRWRLVRVRFGEPEDLSPVVADLYRTWYRRRGLPGDRLLVESFLLMEPWWALRSGSVPYWMVFNTEQSLAHVQDYLDRAETFDEIRLILFSHGVDSVGLSSADDWRKMLARARKLGVFTGVDTRAYPRDFASLARAHQELSRIRTTYPMPRPLEWPVAEEFLTGRDELEWHG